MADLDGIFGNGEDIVTTAEDREQLISVLSSLREEADWVLICGSVNIAWEPCAHFHFSIFTRQWLSAASHSALSFVWRWAYARQRMPMPDSIREVRRVERLSGDWSD